MAVRWKRGWDYSVVAPVSSIRTRLVKIAGKQISTKYSRNILIQER